MHTTLGTIFSQEIGVGVMPRQEDIEDKKDLLLHECAKTVLHRKQSRAGMSHSCAIPLILTIEKYYTITDMELTF